VPPCQAHKRNTRLPLRPPPPPPPHTHTPPPRPPSPPPPHTHTHLDVNSGFMSYT
jgi:hypothetical protein